MAANVKDFYFNNTIRYLYIFSLNSVVIVILGGILLMISLDSDK